MYFFKGCIGACINLYFYFFLQCMIFDIFPSQSKAHSFPYLNILLTVRVLVLLGPWRRGYTQKVCPKNVDASANKKSMTFLTVLNCFSCALIWLQSPQYMLWEIGSCLDHPYVLSSLNAQIVEHQGIGWWAKLSWSGEL